MRLRHLFVAVFCLSLFTGCVREQEEGRSATSTEGFEEEALLLEAKDLRLMKLFFIDDSMVHRIVHYKDVQKLVQATLSLHYDPGVNPHNGKKTLRLERITLWKLRMTGPYWWSYPYLRVDSGTQGVEIFHWDFVSEVVPGSL